MTPQERDRVLQVHLAQARGARRNGDLLRSAVRMAIDIKQARDKSGEPTAMTDPLIDTLTEVDRVLEELGLPYAITGSIAGSVHGEPQSSIDVDLILLASTAAASALSRKLSPRFYAPADVLSEAAAGQTFTNVIDNRTSMKVALSFVGDDAFLRQTLARRVRAKIGTGSPAFWFVTPEDVILMKLLWRKDTQSQKQWENALGVARVRGTRMDWKYLFENARTLGIENDLIGLRDEAGI